MENQNKEKTLGVQIKEETDTKIILEWVKQPVNWSDNLGCIFPLLIAATALVFGLVRAFYFFSAGTYSWLFWIIAILVVVVEFLIIRLLFGFMRTHDNTLEEIVTVDLDAQRASRKEKLQSGRIKQAELDLGQISRVLINMEEHGHHHRLYLESHDKDAFQVSIAFATGPYSSEELIEHGKKIGRLLSKPVVLKHTDIGHLISEVTIQA